MQDTKPTLEQLKARNDALYAAIQAVIAVGKTDEALGIFTQSTFTEGKDNITAAFWELTQSWRIVDEMTDAFRFAPVAAGIAAAIQEPRYMTTCGCYAEVEKGTTICPDCHDQTDAELEVA